MFSTSKRIFKAKWDTQIKFFEIFFKKLSCIDWTRAFSGINCKIMDKPPARNLTCMLRERSEGSKSASAELIAIVYDELRRLA
jgi:hypothetical protein